MADYARRIAHIPALSEIEPTKKELQQSLKQQLRGFCFCGDLLWLESTPQYSSTLGPHPQEECNPMGRCKPQWVPIDRRLCRDSISTISSQFISPAGMIRAISTHLRPFGVPHGNHSRSYSRGSLHTSELLSPYSRSYSLRILSVWLCSAWNMLKGGSAQSV